MGRRAPDQIALLEVDVVALEMVLRVLSNEKSGKNCLDIAGLLKIKGSEIQQRYAELMMPAAGPFALLLHRGSLAQPAGKARLPRRRGWQRAARFDLLQPAQDHHLRRLQRGATQHRRADGAWLRRQEHGLRFSDDQQSLRDAVRKGGQRLQLRAPPRYRHRWRL
ncbi:MAG: hypothetical protein U1E57_02560 [Paenacidovorax caeni]